MRRLVADTNVVASALLWGGVPAQLLHAAVEKKIALFTSSPLLAELADILGRRKFEKKIAESGYISEQHAGGLTPNARMLAFMRQTILPPLPAHS